MADMNDPDSFVFIVEDDDVLRQGMLEYVSKLKHKVEGFASGNAAYTAIQSRNVKLVISDWMMPDGDGIELLNKLRADEKTAAIPFILMSGAVTKEQLEGAIKHDPDGIILKPFGMQILPERIRAAVDLREKKELEKLIKKSGV